MRVSVVAACLSLCLIGFSSARDAHASVRKETNIPAEGLGPALSALAKDRNFQIVYVTEEIANVRTEGAVGEFTTDEALKRLLAGTGLTYRYLDDKTVTIGSATTPSERGGQASKPTSSVPSEDASPKEGKKNSSQDFRVAQVDQGKGSSVSSIEGQNSKAQEKSKSPSIGLEEIVVTAQKREERLQDVPVAVTALNTGELISDNQVRLEDWYTKVPGLSLTEGNRGESNIVIRGISVGIYTTPTVAITIDDVPYGSTSPFGGAYAIPDIDPNDLQQIEVLRGPQGTLYGASGMGGLVRFVTVDPSTEKLYGSVDAGVRSVKNAAEPGYNLRGSLNVPLSDTLALRVSGFGRTDPGYIDDPSLAETGVNKVDVGGGRAVALWRPTDTFSLKVAGLLQVNDREGGSRSDDLPGLTNLQQQDALAGLGKRWVTLELYSADMNLKLGEATLTSVSAYGITKARSTIDYTFAFAGLTESLFPTSTGGTALNEQVNTNKFTEELRLALPLGPRIDGLFGVYYGDEKSSVNSSFYAQIPPDGAVVGTLFDNYYPTSFVEYAGFTNITFHLTDKFDTQLGARESHNEQHYTQTITGVPLFAKITPLTVTSGDAFTFNVAPEYKISPDLMVYSRVASGYRAGGPNFVEAHATVTPPAYDPDRTTSYEIGSKGSLIENWLSYDVSVFDVEWQHLQVTLVDPGNQMDYTGNAGAARSKGVEMAIDAKPISGLTISPTLSWTDATLTKTSSFGLEGARLPYSSRFSGSLSANQQIEISSDLTGVVGATLSYVGARDGALTGVSASGAPGLRSVYPSYDKVDLHAGLQHNAWSFNAFISNLTDKRGVLGGGLGTSPSYSFDYVEPRSIGLSVDRRF